MVVSSNFYSPFTICAKFQFGLHVIRLNVADGLLYFMSLDYHVKKFQLRVQLNNHFLHTHDTQTVALDITRKRYILIYEIIFFLQTTGLN